jgi:hypothetical protein
VNGEAVGMVPRAARYLFQRIEELQQSQPDMKVKVIATFCEVYNEQVGSTSAHSPGHESLSLVLTLSPATAILIACVCLSLQQVYDLLDLTNDVLAVKWDAKAKTFVVSDLLPVECRTIDDVTTVLAEGYRNRRIGSTALNKESSRSHRWVVGLCIAVKF